MLGKDDRKNLNDDLSERFKNLSGNVDSSLLDNLKWQFEAIEKKQEDRIS